ncbi:MAG: FMN-binding protein [Ruminococcus sp.]|nr:FMN-binding protein [Ruminococcus sp.]
MIKQYILPPLVLTLICAAVSSLLALAYDATYVDETGVMTDKLSAACEEAAGKGSYSILLSDDNENKTPVTFDDSGEVAAIITDKDRKVCLIEMREDGYETGGLDFVVGIDDEGKVTGVSFVDCKETPGLGSRATESEYLDKYKKADNDKTVDEVDNVTAATFSSKGLKKGIKKALDIYSSSKGEIFK